VLRWRIMALRRIDQARKSLREARGIKIEDVE
jgi:hypothetical protein